MLHFCDVKMKTKTASLYVNEVGLDKYVSNRKNYVVDVPINELAMKARKHCT